MVVSIYFTFKRNYLVDSVHSFLCSRHLGRVSRRYIMKDKARIEAGFNQTTIKIVFLKTSYLYEHCIRKKTLNVNN